MSHARAVVLMIVVTLLWSIAGVVARHLEAARSFEVTFWRSFFNTLTLTLALSAMRGPTMWRQLPDWPRSVWISGICWAVMFTAFMVALTLTSVANVLITMALAPLVTALFARSFLHQHLPPRTWMAIAAAGLGIAWMFGNEARQGASPLGTLVALAVPLASAVNWTVLQHMSRRETAQRTDMLPAVWIGAVLSAGLALPLALPLQASAHDIGLLALLGAVQLAVPCLLVVRLSRELPAPEIALLALLEVVFGVAWAWLGAGERPASETLIGGSIVLAALIGNELQSLRTTARSEARTSES